MPRILCILGLLVSLSGLAGVVLEAECAEACDGAETSGASECQDCACCLSLRCLLPDVGTHHDDRPDVPLVLPPSDNQSTAHPLEISHVPRFQSL